LFKYLSCVKVASQTGIPWKKRETEKRALLGDEKKIKRVPLYTKVKIK